MDHSLSDCPKVRPDRFLWRAWTSPLWLDRGRKTGRFKAFSTSRDCAVATSLVKGPYRPDGFLATDFRETRRGSVLVYAVQPRREAIVGPPTLGLVILPPRN